MKFEPIFKTKLKSLKLIYRGKVRDIYKIDNEKIMIIQTDRISAHDFVLPNPIPNKGIVLTKIAKFWFSKYENIVRNHILNLDPLKFVSEAEENQIYERSIVVKKLKPLPIESIVRAHLAGSAWLEYNKKGKVGDIALPFGLKRTEKLSTCIFTPSTKASVGEHDENISFEKMKKIIGSDLAERVKKESLKLFNEAYIFLQKKNIIMADTKFEFGTDKNGKVFLIDELFTPDSSRFWDSEKYKEGTDQESFDKQLIRNWLNKQRWDKKKESPPIIPKVLVEKITKKYNEALVRITEQKM